jgi:hypothetical protein
VTTKHFFDTLQIDLGARAISVYQSALETGFNLRQVKTGVLGIALNEKTTRDDVAALIKLIAGVSADIEAIDAQIKQSDPRCRPNCCVAMRSSRTRCSTVSTPNTRCCATSSACRTRIWRSTTR